jgi:hypothetical protein
MISALLNWDKKAAQNTPMLMGIFGSVVFLFWLFYWICPPEVKLFTDDADSYIHYGPTRTIGYLVVLSLVKFLTGGYEAISFVQLSALCGAVFWAAVSLSRFLRSFVLGLALIVAILSLSEIVKFCFEIYTESLGVSLLLMLAASCLAYVKNPARNPLFLMGLLTGLLILLRPSSYALLGAVLVLFLFYNHKITDIFKCFIPPLLICLLAGSAVNYVRHGFFSTQSFMGHNLYGKMAFVVTDTVQSSDMIESEMIQKMAKGMHSLQTELNQINSLKLYFILSTPLHDKLRFFLLDKKFKPTMPQLSEISDMDSFYKKVALRIIVQNPTAYLKDVMIHYTALWFVWDLITFDEKELLTDWINHLKITDAFKGIEQDYSWYKFRQKNTFVIFLIRGFLYFCFCLSFVFIARGLRSFWKRESLEEKWGIGLFLSLAIHAMYFSTALFQAGYPRYAMFMWPYLFMMALTFVGIVKEKIDC